MVRRRWFEHLVSRKSGFMHQGRLPSSAGLPAGGFWTRLMFCVLRWEPGFILGLFRYCQKRHWS